MIQITEEKLKEYIVFAKSKLPSRIKWSTRFTNTIYMILKSYHVDNIKYVFLSAPTGSGKTFIAIVVSYISMLIEYCENEDNQKYNNSKDDFPNMVPEFIKNHTFYLTSTLSLQDQLRKDIEDMQLNLMTLISSANNFQCLFNSERPIPYKERPCYGVPKESPLYLNFIHCRDNCPYLTARDEAIKLPFTVMNYNYFGNTFKGNFSLFKKRKLTICDEAHLVPEKIVSDYTPELTNYPLKRLFAQIQQNDDLISEKDINILNILYNKGIAFFNKDLQNLDVKTAINEVINYQKLLVSIIDNLNKYVYNIDEDTGEILSVRKKIYNMVETFKNQLSEIDFVENILIEYPDLIYIESNVIESSSMFSTIYKHTIRNIVETQTIQRGLIENSNNILFMSATLGNVEEFVNYLGLSDEKTKTIILKSDFDFSKSPIVICNVGNLARKGFQNNIDNCLNFVIRTVENTHPNEKGIIHTHTNQITNLFKARLKNYPGLKNFNRYLFYSNAKEKEANLDLMRTSKEPLVLVGPSLFEGLDLKDDMGRFNIIIKTPYPILNGYNMKRKDLYPFLYERETIEKTQQAIGRTNRHKNDYSTVYLIDSSFKNILHKIALLDSTFENRLKW